MKAGFKRGAIRAGFLAVGFGALVVAAQANSSGPKTGAAQVDAAPPHGEEPRQRLERTEHETISAPVRISPVVNPQPASPNRAAEAPPARVSARAQFQALRPALSHWFAEDAIGPAITVLADYCEQVTEIGKDLVLREIRIESDGGVPDEETHRSAVEVGSNARREAMAALIELSGKRLDLDGWREITQSAEYEDACKAMTQEKSNEGRDGGTDE